MRKLLKVNWQVDAQFFVYKVIIREERECRYSTLCGRDEHAAQCASEKQSRKEKGPCRIIGSMFIRRYELRARV